MSAPLIVPQTGVPAVDRVNDGLRFLLERVFEPGVECRRGLHGSGHCDFDRCSRLDAILRFVSRNFAHQDQVMAEAGYPERQGHGDDHAALIDHLSVMMRAKVCAERDSAKVQAYLVHWLMDHARRCDHPLGDWLRAAEEEVRDERGALGDPAPA
jgi:hemerythrin